MGLEENRYATMIRRRLLSPPNPVPDAGIDLRRKRIASPPPPPPEPIETQPEQNQATPPTSLVLPFQSKALTVVQLIGFVGKYLNITTEEILSADRRQRVAFARHIAFWLCIKHFPKRSISGLSHIFKKDHTSVIHGRDRIRRYLTSECSYGVLTREIIAKVEGEINELNRRLAMAAECEPDMAVRSEASI